MKRAALVFLMGCARPSANAPSDAAVRANVPEAPAIAASAPVETQDAAPPPEPIACSDAGPPAFYLVATGDQCNVSSTLEWIEPDEHLGTPHLASGAADVPLLHDMRWAAELPDCFGANAVITEARKTRERSNDATYHVKVEGHDNGGMGCHAWYTRTFEGDVVVEYTGALLRADFKGTQTVSADDKPECREVMKTTHPSVRVRRSCKP